MGLAGAWTMRHERFGNYMPLYLYADNKRKTFNDILNSAKQA